VNVEGRERFFRAIAERIDVDRVAEVHVFPAIRQGGRESGVAVVTLRPEAPKREVVEQDDVNAAEQVEDVENVATGENVVTVESVADVEDLVAGESVDDTEGLAGADGVDDVDDIDLIDDADEVHVDDIDDAGDVRDADEVEVIEGAMDSGTVVDAEDVEELVDARAEAQEAPLPPPAPPRRFTVLRAHYRLQLKGPERGKWEVGVVEEADAPAATVDEVVRGVHERAGGWSVEGPEHLTGDEFRAALAEEPWSATR
jgi:hypothetical protein